MTDADLPWLAARVPRPAGAAAAALQLEDTRRSSGAPSCASSRPASRRPASPSASRRPPSSRRSRSPSMPEARATDWDYSDQDPYVMASVIVRFNLFSGGCDRASVRAARARSAELAGWPRARRAADPHPGARGALGPRGRRGLARDREPSRRRGGGGFRDRREETRSRVRCRRPSTSMHNAR